MHLCIDGRLFSANYGIGRYTFELFRQFVILRPFWKFTLILHPEEHAKHSFPASVTVIECDAKIYSFAEQTKFLSVLNSINADITWFPHFAMPLLFHKPFVVTVHDLTLSKFPGKKKNSFLHRFAYTAVLNKALHQSKAIFAVSEYTKNDIIHDENISSEKITVGYNAVGKEFLEYISDESFSLKSMGISSPFFLYVGNWREHKNLLGLIQGFHQFLNKTNIPMQLVVTGKEDPLYPEFLEYRKQHGLEKQVITPGLVSEKILMELYKRSKAFVFPSFYEGFGLPPLEAMAMGTPVIASSASCIPEICADAVLYFNPYIPEELATQMQAFITNPDIQTSLIQKGKDQVQKYSWKTTAEILLKKFEELCTIQKEKN